MKGIYYNRVMGVDRYILISSSYGVEIKYNGRSGRSKYRVKVLELRV